MSKDNSIKLDRLVVTGISPKAKKEISQIAKQKGKTVSKYIRSMIHEDILANQQMLKQLNHQID